MPSRLPLVIGSEGIVSAHMSANASPAAKRVGRRLIGTAALIAVLIGSVPYARAQDQVPHDHTTMDMPASGWQFMQDGSLDVIYNRQGGPRGGDEALSTNWWMGMWTRSIGARRLTLTGMLSLDALTAGEDGYREVFQVGETLNGRPLVDRQHPHDLFMQLSAAWRTPLSDKTAITLAGAPAGQPALGPPAFMHRASVAEIPFAPLSHHTFDSTHIAFGVATVAVEHGPWTIEASAFNGREPDQHRWDFDLGRMDSVSARFWFRPAETWTVQVSSGRLIDPESLEPGKVIRRTASASWWHPTSRGFAAATFGYGSNAGHSTTRHAAFGEGSWKVGATTLSSRVELIQVELDRLLESEHDLARKDAVVAITLGGARDVVQWKGIEAALAVNATAHVVPESLRDTHGRHPVSFQIFLRIRPVAGGMGRMWNMRMGQ